MKQNKPLESRVFGGFQFRAEPEKVNGYTFLHGRAVPYGTPATIGRAFHEIHEAGSFAASIEGGARALPLLLFHDSRTFPVGAVDKWEDSVTGLDGVWKLDRSDDAQRAAQLAADGMLTGMSIGFVPLRDYWVDPEDPRAYEGPESLPTIVRTESRLMEVSLTPTPAFAQAAVSLVRSSVKPPTLQPDGMVAQPAADFWRQELEQLRNA